MTSVRFFRPKSIAEAIERLVEDDDARLLAGGQSLVATLAMGVYQPTAFVTLAGIRELRDIERLGDGTIRIGAMATHAEIAACRLFEAGQLVIPSAAAQIANPAVRNFGTIGGSCAHGDPASDWPSALVAASAAINAVGPDGPRTIAAIAFFRSFLTTDLKPGELIVSIDVPGLPGFGLHRKLARVVGDYATVSVSVVVARSGSICASARIAVGSYDVKPVRSDEADAVLTGRPINDELALHAGSILADAGEPSGDVRGSATYRRRVLPVFVARAVAEGLVQ